MKLFILLARGGGHYNFIYLEFLCIFASSVKELLKYILK